MGMLRKIPRLKCGLENPDWVFRGNCLRQMERKATCKTVWNLQIFLPEGPFLLPTLGQGFTPWRQEVYEKGLKEEHVICWSCV
jgi:hypothetical protein